MVVFGVLAVGALLVFAGLTGSGQDTSTGLVLIWGTEDQGTFQTVLAQLAEDDDRFRQVAYEQRDPRTYNQDIAEALASGTGPDLFLLREDFIERHRDKIIPIPYSNLPQQQFVSTFVEASEVFLGSEGALGIPIAVDPLVLYWNRDMLSSASFAGPPQYWDEVFTMAEAITRRDDANNIEKSTIAFGEFENVVHAKQIMSTLIMQAGGQVTTFDTEGRVRPALSTQSPNQATQPTQSALRFFTEFANPTKEVYSWNRSLPDSLQSFSNGDLALYVGFASEYPLIQALNPNLNFAVAELPQIRGVDRRVSFAHVDSFAIPLAAANPQGALSIAFILAGQGPSELLAESRGTPSPRRDVLIGEFDGPALVFRNMALIGKAWRDPDPAATAGVFQDMIEDVTTGRTRLSDAVGQADKALANLLGL